MWQQVASKVLAVTVMLLLSWAGEPPGGEKIFATLCGACHHAHSREVKVGPGLKGFSRHKNARRRGKPAGGRDALRARVEQGGGGMPAFREMLTPEELDELLAYLRSL